MNLLRGKRLLVLGGNPWAKAIFDFAKEYDITVIAAGNNSNNAIFNCANEKYIVDSTNKEEMKKLIVEKKIDGVYMGGTEAVISIACEYINELNLPCYCNKHQWDYLQNKLYFKEICLKHGLPVVPKYNLYKRFHLDSNLYPVITKPVDGCGSDGFSICRNDNELKSGYCKAKDFSASKEVIIEKYVNNSGVVCFYTISNGRIFFSGLSDKYPVRFEKQGSYVGGLFVYQSNLIDDFREKFENKIQEMVTDLRIKEGPLWIEVFFDKGEYYFNEAGFRYGGSVSVYPVNYLSNINQVASDIYFSLTGISKIYGHGSLIPSNIVRKKYYAVYPIFVTHGIINEIYGFEEISKNNNVVTIIKKLGKGNNVNDTGSWSQTFALIHFVFNSALELKEMINLIHETIIIKDIEGKDLSIRMLDINHIKEYK